MAIRILLVEDDPETLDLMATVLRSFDVGVLPVGDSEEALAIINREKFDGIFLDLVMPRLDGYRLAKAVRRSGWNSTTPIVIVTGSNDRKVMQEAFHAGGSFFLPKPVDRNRLALLLNTTRGAMLANRRGLQRAPMRVPVLRDRAVEIWSCNISERGLLVEGDRGLYVGQPLSLTFALPRQAEVIAAEGVVARVDTSGRAGIAFRHLRPTDRQRIRIYVTDELEQAPVLEAEFAKENVT